MKLRILSIALALAVAGGIVAQPLESVLTQSGALYTIDTIANGEALLLTKRQGGNRESNVIPATAASGRDHDGRLLYDGSTNTIYVAFRRDSGDIVLTSLDANGRWSHEQILSPGDGTRRSALRIALTHDKDGERKLTFVHAIWWEQTGTLVPRYALAAYDGNHHLSTYVGSLIELAAGIRNGSNEKGLAPEDSLPLLAMTASANEVDIVFGSLEVPTATRIKLLPKKKGDARIYTPIGRSGGNMPHPRFASASNGNAHVMMVGDRIVVYSTGESFRFSVFENGAWGPVRSIKLDASMTAAQVEAALRKAVTETADSAAVAIHQ